MLHQIIFWLQQRKFANLTLVFGYFLFILLMHNPLVHLYIWIEKQLTLEVFNVVIAVIFLLLVTGATFLLSKHFFKYPENRELKVFYALITLTLLLAHSRFMFDSNIEVIHSLEFTFLTFLIFPLSKRFGAAVFCTLPFMLFDEWYQYIILYPEWNDYFDLNDILMDTYGCGLTMIVLMIIGVKGDENVKPFWKRPEFISLLCLVVAILIAAKFCFVATYANEACSNTLLVMNERMSAEPFFRPHPTHNISYHVMNPVEGFIAITILHFIYLGLDSFRKP